MRNKGNPGEIEEEKIKEILERLTEEKSRKLRRRRREGDWET
jgi:hypothetical protein